jgi:hypothetical protein
MGGARTERQRYPEAETDETIPLRRNPDHGRAFRDPCLRAGGIDHAPITQDVLTIPRKLPEAARQHLSA